MTDINRDIKPDATLEGEAMTDINRDIKPDATLEGEAMTDINRDMKEETKDSPSDLAVQITEAKSVTRTPDQQPAAPSPPVHNLAESIRQSRRQARNRSKQQRRLGRKRRLGRIRKNAIAALVSEQDIIGQPRDPEQTTFGENVIHSLGKAGGDAELSRSQRRLDRIVQRSDHAKISQATLRIRAAFRPGYHVRHPSGGYSTVAEIQEEQAALRAKIAAETDQGSRKHDRLPGWLRRIPAFVAICDFAVLLYFFGGVTNVDWSQPVSVSLALALVIAALVTGAGYSFFAVTGNRMRAHKDHAGTIPLGELDWLTLGAVGASAGGIVVLSTLMFVRMRAEVLDTLGQQATTTAAIVAAALAAVSLLANALVIMVHALDGSESVDRLEALGAAAYPALNHAHRQLERAAAQDPVIAGLARKAMRTAATGITEAGSHRTAADQIIDIARSIHQGAGPFSELTADPNSGSSVIGYRSPDSYPEVDQRPLLQALEQAHTPLSTPTAQEGEAPQT